MDHVAEYWLDSDSLIRSHRGPYKFGMAQIFWDFLETKAHEGIIGSPAEVLDMELASSSSKKDLLEQWAKRQKGILFVQADAQVQAQYTIIAEYVQNCGKYKQQWIAQFLSKADPWLVAYPMALGGRIVTFEKPQPRARKPKIPDIAQQFGIKHLDLYEMLSELGFQF